MKEVTINIYDINELTDKVRNKAYQKWLESDPYCWGMDNESTLKAFERVFPVKVGRWEYGYSNFIAFEFTDHYYISDLTGIRLMKYLINNYNDILFKASVYYRKGRKRVSRIFVNSSCVLTGYYMDDEILEPIYRFLKNPIDSKDFKDLMGECLQAWVRACADDFQQSTSFEYFLNDSKDNGYYYYEDGRIYGGVL